MKYRLEEIADIYDSLHQTPIYTEDGIHMVRVTDLSEGYLNLSKTLKVSEEVYNEFTKKYVPRKNDIIMSRVGTYGVCTLVNTEEKFCLGQNTVIISPKQNKKFLYYYLISSNVREQIEGFVTGSTQKTISLKNIRNIIVDLPNEKQQERISNILDNIDKKIELNNQINDNLFEIALRLFNKFLEDNAEIENIKLEECVGKINTGADAIQRAPIVDYDTGIRCIRIGDMTNNRDYHSWGFAKMTEKDFDNYKLLKNDIVITRTAVNGLTYMITNEENVVCNNGNIRLRVNNRFNPLYIYLYTKIKEFRNYIDRINGETSVRPNMKVEYLTNFLIKNVDLEKQNKICKMIQPLMGKIQSNKNEIFTLEQLRNTLLPKLMNGEINLDKIEI